MIARSLKISPIILYCSAYCKDINCQALFALETPSQHKLYVKFYDINIIL